MYEGTTLLLMAPEVHSHCGMKSSLGDLGLQVLDVCDESEAMECLQARPDIRVVLLDTHDLDGPGGLDFVRCVNACRPDVGFVIVSREVRHLHPGEIPDNSCFLPLPVPVDLFLEEVCAQANRPLWPAPR